jgi:hypothetical protein
MKPPMNKMQQCDQAGARGPEEPGAPEATPGEVDVRARMPFGELGAAFLCNVLQHSLFLGLAMVVLIIIHYFGTR